MKQLERRRQHREFLPLQELLDPPVGIVWIGDPGNGLARPFEALERSGLPGVLDEPLDPALPALARRLPLGHRAVPFVRPMTHPTQTLPLPSRTQPARMPHHRPRGPCASEVAACILFSPLA